MKLSILFLSILIGIKLTAAEAQEIEIKVRFIEISESAFANANISWQFDQSAWQPIGNVDITDLLLDMEKSGDSDLLSAPKIRTLSGTNAIIKVVTEYIYPTGIKAELTSITNGKDVVNGISIVPCDFATRNVGVTLDVTPLYIVKNDTIKLIITAAVVSDPIWKNYTAKYQGADGKEQIVELPQPFFFTRSISNMLYIRNNTTVVIGGTGISTSKRLVEDRIPILGAIPWLGRLFRSTHEITEKRNLIITVTARTLTSG